MYGALNFFSFCLFIRSVLFVPKSTKLLSFHCSFASVQKCGAYTYRTLIYSIKICKCKISWKNEANNLNRKHTYAYQQKINRQNRVEYTKRCLWECVCWCVFIHIQLKWQFFFLSFISIRRFSVGLVGFWLFWWAVNSTEDKKHEQQ